jgi:phosphoglycolate phosphatase-like HAD superfamily hydrolase
MAVIQMGQVPFDADLVAFDKDGTLIDFEVMWGRLVVMWVERLAANEGDEALSQALFDALGYDLRRQRTVPQSPLAIASTGQLQAIAAAVLYRHGTPWTEALDRAVATYPSGANVPLAGLIQPAGDVGGLLARLQAAGVRVAVVTTDQRAETEETLEFLEIHHLVDATICGDDGLPIKPAPDMLLAACQQLQIAPSWTALVGDTMADLMMAQRAGAGFRAAVLTGAGDVARLQGNADVVLGSIDEITLG